MHISKFTKVNDVTSNWLPSKAWRAYARLTKNSSIIVTALIIKDNDQFKISIRDYLTNKPLCENNGIKSFKYAKIMGEGLVYKVIQLAYSDFL